MYIQKNNTTLVQEVMLSIDSFPILRETVIFKEALEEMGTARLGIVCIVNEEKKLIAILTDGDIRRKLLKVQKPFSAFFVDDVLKHSIQSPITVGPKESLLDAVMIMEEKKVWDLPVVDNEGVLVGLLHLHPAVKALLGVEK